MPADTLEFSGGFFQGIFISSFLNPAASGVIRLAGGDAINFRNQANSADITGLSHNSDDTITVGGVMKQSFIQSANANPAQAGVLRLGNNESIAWRNSINTFDEFLYVDTSDHMVDTATNGFMLVCTNPNVRLGGSTSAFPMLKGNSNAVNVRLADDSGDAALTALSLALSGAPILNGPPVEVAAVNLTGVSAGVGSTIYTTVGAGQYRVTWNAKVTTAAGSSSTLGAFTIAYTDPDGTLITLTGAAMISAGTIATTSTGNTVSTVLIGLPLLLNCQAASALTYAMAYTSSPASAMAYNLHIKVEAM